MNLRDRIPVEPLSDEKLTQLERRVVVGATDAAPRALGRSRVPGFLAAAALAIIVGIVGWRLGAGTTAIAPPDAAPEMTSAEPIRIDTRERTTVDIGDARITNDPDTQLVITRPAGGVVVEMTRGRVELEVGTRGGRPPLVVRAGDTDVVVVGTRFTVDYGDGTHPPIVIVTEGIVEVVRGADRVRVAAEHAWTIERGMVRADALVRTAAVDIPPPGTVSLGDRTPTVPPGTLPTDRPAPVANAGSAANDRPGTKQPVMQYTENLHAALRAQPITPAHALGIEDTDKAIAAHYVSAAGRGDDAARALYSIAVLQLLKQRAPAKALSTLEHYFDRFSQKSQHADALWLRVRILCERRFDERCRHAAGQYAEKVPTGPKAGMALQVSGTVE